MGAKKRRVDKEVDYAPVGSFLLKIAYDGSKYFGLAIQNAESSASYFEKHVTPEGGATPVLPTVESALEACLKKAKLIRSLAEAGCSRCGRTDRGVHARGNYISIQLRLQTIKSQSADDPNTRVHTAPYDYKRILNAMLPGDIRVIWVRPCPIWFDARFHCLYRMYKYYFPIKSAAYVSGRVDLGLMEAAAGLFRGDHDFANFCKRDPATEKTTRRRILICEVQRATEHVGVLVVSGPAFLWHQVRCIAGCLLDVGSGVLSPSVIPRWLDVVLTPTKPPYTMAPAAGLVLWDCWFEQYPCAANSTDWCRPADLPAAAPALASAPAEDAVGTFAEQIAKLRVRQCVLDGLCAP